MAYVDALIEEVLEKIAELKKFVSIDCEYESELTEAFRELKGAAVELRCHLRATEDSKKSIQALEKHVRELKQEALRYELEKQFRDS